MKVTAYKTRLVSPGDDLFEVIGETIERVPERSVLVVASKIVSFCEGRLVAKRTGTRQEKHELVREEAEYYLDSQSSKYDIMLTKKRNWIFANAGIDESNAQHQYVLWPKDPQRWADRIWRFLRKNYRIKKVGVTISDSRSSPLNWGVIGHAIANSGFKALRSYIGKPDLFGREMKVTQVNVMQGVTAAAVLAMGEGAERTPLALVEEVGGIEYQNRVPSKKELTELKIELNEDIYAPLLTGADWKRGGSR